MSFVLPGILALSTLCPLWTPAPTADGRMHPYLIQRVLEVSSRQELPVYFVIGERLGYDHWFPRVNQLPVEERRQVVMRELKEHAALTQEVLLERLRELETQGRVTEISSNWLGNFVQCRIEPSALLEIADLPSVVEIWFDYVPPLSEVEDTDPLASGPASGVSPASAPSTFFAAGNGPLNTHADQVWAFGVDGSGVVVMNADSGIEVSHNDLMNRLWVNPGEIPANGVDDDGNGFVDDINGWNFGSNNNILGGSGTSHGTNTAGCLVADGTCTGTVYGQAPGAQVMTGRLSGEASQWNAIQYGIQMGAHCQTSSHSYKNNFSPPPNYKMHRDVGETSLAAGLIRTNSTSNNGSSCNSTTSLNRRPFNISAPGNLPPPYIDPNQTLVGRKGGVMGVAAHDVNSNNLTSYSPCGPFAWFLADVLAVNPSYPAANWDSVNDDDYPYTGGSQQGLLKPDLSSPTNTTTTSSPPCGTTTFSGTSNATPNANGVLCLWKSANMSLTPEDVAMIAHQSATSSGSVPGKENNWGAGRIDALAGLYLALCTHRVNGEPAWATTIQTGSIANLELDTVPNSPVVIAVGSWRTATQTGGGVIGIGEPAFILYLGQSDAAGNASFQVPIPPFLVGFVFYTQGFTGDSTVTGSVLSSNVIETTIVP